VRRRARSPTPAAQRSPPPCAAGRCRRSRSSTRNSPR